MPGSSGFAIDSKMIIIIELCISVVLTLIPIFIAFFNNNINKIKVIVLCVLDWVVPIVLAIILGLCLGLLKGFEVIQSEELFLALFAGLVIFISLISITIWILALIKAIKDD